MTPIPEPLIWRFRQADGTLLAIAGERRPVKPGEMFHLFQQTGVIAHVGQGDAYLEFVPVQYEQRVNDTEAYLPTVIDKPNHRAMFIVPVECTRIRHLDVDGNPIDEGVPAPLDETDGGEEE